MPIVYVDLHSRTEDAGVQYGITELRRLQSWCYSAVEEIIMQRDVVSSSSSENAQYVWYKKGGMEMLRSFMIESTVIPLHEVLLEIGDLITDEEFCDNIYDMIAMSSFEKRLRKVVPDELDALTIG
eukprot:IDg6765t1